MPLKVLSIVEQRHLVVLDVTSGRASVREAAARFEVSATQLYQWLRRYRAEGLPGLVPRSRRPLSTPGQTAAEVEDAIVTLHKQRRGRWGAKKIRAVLLGDGVACPSVATTHAILVRRGLVEHHRRRPRDPGQRFERAFCNELWQIDGTQHRLRNGREFWVVDILDDHSRFLLAAHVGSSLTGSLAWAALRQAVAGYGLPAQLLSDNGTVFTGRLHGVEVRFETAARRAGIELLHARPYHPQTVGKNERQHATQNAWIADHRPTGLTQAQQVLDAYRDDDNTVRPHEALGQLTPASRHQPAQPVHLPPLDDLDPAGDYPPGCPLRKPDPRGVLRYSNHRFQLSTRWAEVPLGLVREGARLHLYYGKARVETLIVGELPHPHRYRGNQ